MSWINTEKYIYKININQKKKKHDCLITIINLILL